MRWFVVIVAAITLACAGAGPDPAPVPKPPPVPAPPKPIKGNLVRMEVPVGAARRVAWLHVPDPGAKGWDAPLPLVVVFHDRGADSKRTAEMFSRWLDRGVMLAFPAAGDPKDPDQHWDIFGQGKGAGKGAGKPATEDTEFIDSLVDQIKRKYKVAEDKVFATGFANGAAMSWQVACRLPDLFDGIAPVAGTMPRKIAEDCLAQPVPLLLVAGTEDKTSLWTGQNDALAVMDSVGLWLTKNGCDASTDKVTALQDSVPSDGSTVKRHDWTCTGPAVTLLELAGGGHGWPTPDTRTPGINRDIDAADEIMRFFGVGG